MSFNLLNLVSGSVTFVVRVAVSHQTFRKASCSWPYHAKRTRASSDSVAQRFSRFLEMWIKGPSGEVSFLFEKKNSILALISLIFFSLSRRGKFEL